MADTKPKWCNEGCAKRWDGDDPTCGFDADGVFTEKNWNCGVINRIRALCYEGQREMPDGVDYQYCEDQKYATFNINDMWIDEGFVAYALWVCWYKTRGQTEAMWLLDSDEPPRRPTRAELVAIADHYEARLSLQKSREGGRG